MKRGGLFILLLSCHCGVFAQGEPNIWYFGLNTGLDFNAGFPPKIISNGAMTTNEGCATICDRYGRLLMYTDGINVWDREHNVMPNAKKLGGHPSSSQSGVIVPDPGDTSRYYVFSVDYEGASGGVQYAVVDIRLNHGLGDIIPGLKNIRLLTPVTEKLTAVKHADGRNYWVIAHGVDDAKFYAWEVSSEGINPAPVLSETGSVHGPGAGTIGYMKLNAQGTKLAVCIWPDDYFEVFDFDNRTGRVYNPMKITQDVKTAYGCEFSPNGRYLYISENQTGKVCQYDLNRKTLHELSLSRVEVGTASLGKAGALQLTTDGKIYVCSPSHYISAIHRPDTQGLACHYEEKYIEIWGKVRLGLPTFIQSYFGQIDTIYSINACLPEATEFSCRATFKPVKYYWDFGDPASNDNHSDLANPKHVYTAPGVWVVTLTVWDAAGHALELSRKVTVHKKLENNLPKKIIACKGDVIRLTAGNPDAVFTWSTGDTAQSITVASNGIYTVRIKNLNCERTDTTQVFFIDKFTLDLPDTVRICRDVGALLETNMSGLKYRWSNGDTTRYTYAVQPGVYKLNAGIDSCLITDSVVVLLYPEYGIPGEEELSLCRDTVVYIPAGPGHGYVWEPNNETTKNISVRVSGLYKVTYTNPHGCVEKDSIRVTRFCEPLLYVPNAFTPNGKDGNEIFMAKGAGISEFELVIFNRWGQKVFYSTDMSKGWDGTFNEAPANEGVYFYKINYKGDYSAPLTTQGTLTLMR